MVQCADVCGKNHDTLIDHLADRTVLEYFYQDSVSANSTDEMRKARLRYLITTIFGNHEILMELLRDHDH